MLKESLAKRNVLQFEGLLKDIRDYKVRFNVESKEWKWQEHGLWI